MKKVLGFIVIVSMAIVSIVMCCSSGANPSNEAQLFVGSWTLMWSGRAVGEMTFGANGSVTGTLKDKEVSPSFFGVGQGKMTVVDSNGDYIFGNEYRVSPDGKTVLVYEYGRPYYILRKK